MLTRQQRTRKHFSQLCPFGKPLKISILASKPAKCPQKPGSSRLEAGSGFFQGWSGGNQDRAPRGRRRQGVSTYSQNSMTGEVAFCRDTWLWLVAFSFWNSTQFSAVGNRTRNKKINLCEGWSLAQHSELMVQPGGFYSATPGKHASQSSVGKINHVQTV